MDHARPWIAHLIQLRHRLIYIGLGWIVGSILFYILDGPHYTLHFMLLPLKQLSPHIVFMSHSLWEAFFIHMHICLWGGFILALPWTLWQSGCFIYPALFPHERWFVGLCFLLSLCCTAFSVYITYYFMIPKAWAFFLSFYHGSIILFPHLHTYVLTFTGCLVGSLMCFQLPIMIIVLWKIGWMPSRRWIFLGIGIFSAVAAPPDWFSPVMMTAILYGMYEGTRGALWLYETYSTKSP